MRLFHSRCTPLHLPLLSFLRFFLALFSTLVQSLWMAAVFTREPTFPSSMTLPTNLLGMHSVPWPKSLINALNSIGPVLIPERHHWSTTTAQNLYILSHHFEPDFPLIIYFASPNLTNLTIKILRMTMLKALMKTSINKLTHFPLYTKPLFVPT